MFYVKKKHNQKCNVIKHFIDVDKIYISMVILNKTIKQDIKSMPTSAYISEIFHGLSPRKFNFACLFIELAKNNFELME